MQEIEVMKFKEINLMPDNFLKVMWQIYLQPFLPKYLSVSDFFHHLKNWPEVTWTHNTPHL